jgi:hypothetical protein
MSQVPATKTPCTPLELVAGLMAAYAAQMGHEPEAPTLAVLCAQVALETANMHSLICWNIGNIKRGPGPDWCAFSTFEYVGTPPVKTPMVCEFSAWPSLESACERFVSFLYLSYPEAWEAATHGDPEGFARGLRSRGYFTAPVELYAAGVRAWFATYSKLLGGAPSPTADTLPAPAEVVPVDLDVEVLDVGTDYPSG